jgi:PAS domain S-box-containing protein
MASFLWTTWKDQEGRHDITGQQALYHRKVLTIMKTSDRKKIEEALLEIKQRFSDFTESALELIWEFDAVGRYTYANPRYKDILGYEPNELIGKSVYDLFPTDATKMKEECRALLGSHQPFSRWMNIMVHKNGQQVIVESCGVPYFDSKGQFVGYRGIDHDITEQERLRENMQFYAEQITKAQEEERKRVARELHDETAQILTRVMTDCEFLLLKNEDLSEQTRKQLKQIRDMTGDALQGVRRFSLELRPSVLDRLGLIPSLELLVKEFGDRVAMKCHLDLLTSVRRLSPDTELALYRIAQEALRNCEKHALATEVIVRVEFAKDRVNLSVIDNGIGFVAPNRLCDFTRSAKLGIMSMRQRARVLNGQFQVESKRGKGTTISAEIPI